MDFHDLNGKVFCDGCEKVGRPKGGVTTKRILNKVHISYDLPEGWALVGDGEVLCSSCGLKVDVSVFDEKSTKLSDAVLLRGNQFAGPAQGYKDK